MARASPGSMAAQGSGRSQPEEREHRENNHAESGDPHGHQTAGHGVSLGLGIQVGDDPPAGWLVPPGCDHIGVFAWGISQRHPAQTCSRGDDAEPGGSGGPNRESGPRRRPG